MVQYKYDAWGKQISKTGTLASTLGTVQPFRYRGYVYDEETGLYYLQTRYYCNDFCRFLNADTLMGVCGAICSHNIYSYGMNVVVNIVDTNGKSIIMITDDDNLSHTSLLIRGLFGDWHYFYWGADPEHATISFHTDTGPIQTEIEGSMAIAINAINNQPGNGVIIYAPIYFEVSNDDAKTLESINRFLNRAGLYANSYDRMITFELPTVCSAFADGRAMYLKYNQSELTYNLFTNNCAQLSLDILGWGLMLVNPFKTEELKKQLVRYGMHIIPGLIHTRIDAENFFNK